MRKIILIAPATLVAGILAFAGSDSKDKLPAKQAPSTSKSAVSKTTAAKTTAPKSAATKSNAVKTNTTKASVSKAASIRTSIKSTQQQTAKTFRRSSQIQPTPERYKEIQQALGEKGYFGGSPDGNWGPESVDALKRFQHDQNLPEDGKIGSLSLIALGLGPKRDPPPTPVGSAVP